MLRQLDALPRDSRDTLFLLAVIAWVVLPQIGNLPLWCSGLAAGVLLWRGVLAWQAKPLPSKWWLLAILAATAGATLYTHRTLLGRDAGVTMIVVLLALKTLELRAKRDAFVVFFLSFFAMLTNFFFSQSLLTAAAMLIALLGLLTALVNAHMPVGKPPLLQAAKTAGWMALMGAPVMAVLFVLFPRLAPLWGVPGDAMSGRSGLSSSMQVGNIASLALDESIAFRVRFTGPAPAASDLYFRGPVLSAFNGRDWQPLRNNFARQITLPSLQVTGLPTAYEVTLEPNNRSWIFVLDAALAKPRVPNTDVVMTPDLQWLASRPVTDLTRYSAESHTQFRHGPRQFETGLGAHLALPPGSNPRTVALAAQIRSDPANAGARTPELVNAVLNRLRTGGYRYTLEPGVFGEQTADEFWFDRKAGFCEHIASSFVILMRALDVPARIVTGYQGGERNRLDGFWVVRQSDAHAWAEVWVAQQGWVRVDPTSAVAPGRTGTLVRLQAPQGVIAGALSGAFAAVSPSMLANVRAAWEAVNNNWNQWVLNYSQAKQLNLLKDIGFESPSWEDLFYVLIGLLVAVSLAGAAWTRWEKSRHDPWLGLLWRARKQLRQAGIELPASAPPRTMAQLLLQKMAQPAPQNPPGQQPPHSLPAHIGGDSGNWQAVAEWLLKLEAQRYAPAPGRHGDTSATSLRHLQREFSLLPWPQGNR